MQIGFNNDVQYRGKKFHIQTEDHGVDDPRIETQIFHSGQILDTQEINYESLLEDSDEFTAQRKVKALMKKVHEGVYKKLTRGDYDEMVGLEPLEEEELEELDAPAPDEFEPGQDRVPAAAAQVEQQAAEGEEVFTEFHGKKAQKHVDLSSLKNHLNNIDEEDEEFEDASLDDVALTENDEPPAGSAAALALEESSVADEGAAVVDAPDEADDAESEDDEEEVPLPGSRRGRTTTENDVDDSGFNERVETRRDFASAGAQARKSSSSSSQSQSAGHRADVVEEQETREAEDDSIGNEISEFGFPKTGTRAWTGCEEPNDSLSVVPLVEELLHDD